jgi:hypothetical protein
MSFSLFIVAVSREGLSNLPKCGDVGFTFCASALAVLQQEAQDLGHVEIQGWWWRRVSAAGIKHLMRQGMR